MAAVKIGLDFGTHYTKICVVDSADKRNRRYSFFRFDDMNGKPSFVFPSVVQLNKDNTLSYGFVDTTKAAMVVGLPERDAPRKPDKVEYRSYKQFPEPKKPVEPSIQVKKNMKISSLSDLRDAIREKERQEVAEKWAKEEKERYEKAKVEYEIKHKQWEESVARNKVKVDAYNEQLRQDYERKMLQWEEYEHRLKEDRIPAIFRSFKQMVFSNGFDWRFELDPMLVSIWYLCYVFFELDREFGTQYLTVCMGTSSGSNNWGKNKQKATQIILTVYDLIEKVFKHDKKSFLSATLDELKRVTEIKAFSQSEKDDNQIFVFPEAFANLNPLARQKKFGAGVNAVVDIGGGTTDISVFVAPMGEDVRIFDYVSIPYGVNAIENEGKENHYYAIESKMDRFSIKLIQYAQSLGVKQWEASRIVDKRPIVFTGGGSMRQELRRPYIGFTDVIHLGSSLLNNYSIDDAIEVAGKIPLLSTALGLALCEHDKELPLISYSILFEIVEEAFREGKEETEHAADYGLADY